MTPKPQLSWRAAMRIAWREMRASRAKFLFVVLSVAIGVGSLTGVRGFSSSFRHMLMVLDAKADDVLVAFITRVLQVLFQPRAGGVPRHREQHVVDAVGPKCL